MDNMDMHMYAVWYYILNYSNVSLMEPAIMWVLTSLTKDISDWFRLTLLFNTLFQMIVPLYRMLVCPIFLNDMGYDGLTDE